jgi:phospholipid/cholesterol/gamma-HCH transport system substrate-binding protein
MRRERTLSWKDLQVGIMIFFALVIFAFAIVLVGKEVPLFSRKYVLITYLENVSGIKPASQVMLAGVEVGLVDKVYFKHELRRVAVEMKISKKYQQWIRTDSVAYVKTMGALGDKYIDVSIGSPQLAFLKNRDEIQGKTGMEIEKLIDKATETITNIDSVTASLNTVATDLKNGKGTIGKLVIDDSLHKELLGLMTKLNSGPGTVASLINEKDVYNNIKAATEGFAAIAQGKKGIGKVLNDDKFASNLSDTSNKIQALVTDVQQGKGTVGKLMTDEKLYKDIADVAEAFVPLAEDISKGRGTLGKLAQDQALYDNTNKLIQEARLLLTDIRENPKKYLHIKLSLF